MEGGGRGREFCLAGGGAAVARERAYEPVRRANAGFPLTVGFENPSGSGYVRSVGLRSLPAWCRSGGTDPAALKVRRIRQPKGRAA